jgi:glucose/arabinose dehydrogenase
MPNFDKPLLSRQAVRYWVCDTHGVGDYPGVRNLRVVEGMGRQIRASECDARSAKVGNALWGRLQNLTLSFSLVVMAHGIVAAEASDTEQTLEAQFEILMKDLPRPNTTQSTRNFPRTVLRNSSDGLLVPQGFEAELIVSQGLKHPRQMIQVPNGDVFLSEPNAGRITLLRDQDADGVINPPITFAQGLSKPYGMAFTGDALLVADAKAIWKFDYEPGQLQATVRRPITSPGALGTAKGHWSRNLMLSRDGVYAYVAIGSASNLAEEEDPRATIQEVRLKDGRMRTYASGLRNPIGLAFHPDTDELYTVVNERDRMGDRSVPDYLTKVLPGEFYGWPYAFIGSNPDPEFGRKNQTLVAKTREPEVLIEAHSAPLDLVFYNGAAFPPDYKGDAFVTLHGSWNSTRPKGYKVIRVFFDEGRPTGKYENFAVGFWRTGADRARVWGRPAGVLMAQDGTLWLSDDTGKTIWRISFTGHKP